MNNKKLLYSVFLFSYIVFGVVFPINAQQTLVVLNENDDGPGSLRATIELANPSDTIVFDAAVDTVKLISDQLLINKSLTISGHSSKTIILRDTIETELLFRIFEIKGIANPIKVILKNLDIRNGATEEGVMVDPGAGICIPNEMDTLQLLLSNIHYNLTGNGYGFEGTAMAHGGNGGGIFNNGYLIMENCSVSNNTTGNGRMGWDGSSRSYDGGNGGGIYNSGVAEIRECVIKSNKTGYGGVNVDPNKDPVYGWEIRGQPGKGGSGAGICNTGMLKISRCIISRNQAGRGGYGTDSYHGRGTGGDGGDGGALYNASGASCLFELSQISENSAGNGGFGHGHFFGKGGDGGFGGATYNEGSLIQINCLIVGNSSGQAGMAYASLSEARHGATGSGGGICNSSGYCEIISSTICNNYLNLDTTSVGEEKGGGIFQVDGDLRICNSIVANNYKIKSIEYNDTEGNLFADYSLIRSVVSGTVQGESNLFDLDPQFINNEDDFHLSKYSLCINAGSSDTSGMLFPKYDLDSLPRIVDDRIDLGAYEIQDTTHNAPAPSNTPYVYPVPGSDIITVKNIIHSEEIHIYDINGRLVDSYTVTPYKNSLSFNISYLQNGVYCLMIIWKESIETLKIIKN